ncbi:MAG: Nudix hydrolase [Candidatus Falkowbacteria bacterium GW2011_GWF2_39_8]|uniref:Nudix hydrolase n=1 Tax=Candidatus Falkowbacteria bacterium GW2011_GWF2_39_8 TaxID=1618642 RepID=A0A0G0PWK0_9BACT|nr:MAG: Nudix hydrolase [Candidatus Falkowbacteria bacterium GW2011_GWF2_39_8]
MFKYCPLCKEELKNENNHYFCNGCKFDFYHTPNPASSVILVNSKKQIYLAKRAEEPKPGLWAIPGGFIDFHESAEDAARREIKEELGIELTNLQFLCSFANDYLYKGTQYYPLDIFFISKIDLEKIVPVDKKELLDGKFFYINNIPFDEFAFISQKKAIDYYIKLIKN